MLTRDDMIRRQRVLAEFGEFAVSSDDLHAVLTEACRLIAEALDTPLAKIVEIEPGKNSARVIAGVGWADDVVGKATVTLSKLSSESYAIEQGGPLITRDIHKEERFEFADFLKEAGVVALVNIPIFLPGGKAFGLLQVDDTKPREFDEFDIEFLRTYGAILGPVIDRLHKTHALDQSQRLLSEMHHRVKNSLATIVSLVRIRERETGSAEAREELRFIADRMETLRLVHERLLASGKVDEIELGSYLKELLENLLHMQNCNGKQVGSEIDVAEVQVAVEIANPIGLIVNEFVTNSFKYAFPDRDGTICLTLKVLGEGQLMLQLADTGPGLPDSSGANRMSGTGISMIDGLSRQIDAQTDWECDAKGACLSLTIPLR